VAWTAARGESVIHDTVTQSHALASLTGITGHHAPLLVGWVINIDSASAKSVHLAARWNHGIVTEHNAKKTTKIGRFLSAVRSVEEEHRESGWEQLP